MFRTKNLVLTSVVFLVGLLIGLLVVGQIDLLARSNGQLNRYLRLFEDTYNHTFDFYFDEDSLEPELVLTGAIEGVKEQLIEEGTPTDFLADPARLEHDLKSTGDGFVVYLLRSEDTFLLTPPLSGFSLPDPPSAPFSDGLIDKQYIAGFSGDPVEIIRQLIPHLVEDYQIDGQQLVYAAIHGMLAELGDPHTQLLEPESYQQMQTSTEQQFGGLGIHITMEDERLIIIAPMAGTPAFEANLMPGDIIAKIDGKPASELNNVQEAVDILRGEPGSEVTLKIDRGRDDSFEVTLERDIISVKSVLYDSFDIENRNIGLVKINNFGEKTFSEVKNALEELHKQDMEGLILDLRNNPGGILLAANQVADIWLDEGQKIVYTEGRISQHNMHVWARAEGTEDNYPMLVMINGGSASGSEIVTGALQDQKRALVAGDTSFGKASVQSVFPLPEEAALKITTASYFTPSGHEIQDRGIAPQIPVEQDIPDTTVREEIRALQLGDTIIEFVRETPQPSDTEIKQLIEQLRQAGFTLPDKYIRQQIRNQQYAIRGERLVADLATDPQLSRTLELFVRVLDVEPWDVDAALESLDNS